MLGRHRPVREEPVTMPIATPEVYADMLDRAKAGSFAYPAINVSSSQTLNAALKGFADAGSDGIIQVSTGGADYLSGPSIKNMVSGSLAFAAYAHEVAKNYPVNIALHTDHCPKDKLDTFVRPLLAARTCRSPRSCSPSPRPPTSSSRSRSASSAARRTGSRGPSTTSSTRPPRTPSRRSRP